MRKISRFVQIIFIMFLSSLAICADVFAANKAASSKKTAKSSVHTIARDPYVGAISVDVSTGKTIFEDNADARAYPASVIKLMDLLIILEKVKEGKIRLDDKVTVTAEASTVGGSQAFLKEKEVFTVDDMLYAMMVQSANDAATAMAIHVAGTKEGFVKLMNQRAAELGMSNTVIHSVHGLSPSKGQEHDVTTPRDLAILALELAKNPETFRYTSTRKREFMDLGKTRKEPFILETHNHLLGSVEGCDGMKTGWITAAGYSMVVSAIRNGRRAIVVVMGSPTRKGRDAKATEILSEAFLKLPPLEPPKPVVKPDPQWAEKKAKEEAASGVSWRLVTVGSVLGLITILIISRFIMRRFRSYSDSVNFPGRTP